MIRSRLRKRGVLGLNERNAVYVDPWNPRALLPRVDDKVRTKRLLREARVPVPRELGVLRYPHQLRQLDELIDGQAGFALKPARGAQGNGILIVRRRGGRRLVRRTRRDLDRRRIRFHASEILAGLYSLGGQPDEALLEELLEPTDELTTVCGSGVPDLRVIVHRGVPAMAMLRLPTARSGGRANLHRSAVGVGIDLARGRTTTAILDRIRVERHPDTDVDLRDRPVPAFDDCLEYATRATETVGLGYVGVDVVVDARRGALVLEVNARPGLSIQLANRRGLGRILREIDAAPAIPETVDGRLDFARELAEMSR